MAWPVLEHSLEEVDRAGNVLLAPGADFEALDLAIIVINNWRASHHFPINTFQTTLRHKAEHFPKSVVSQRIKRLKAIQHKLQKHTKNPIALSTMQDIGGCRIVLPTLAQMRKVVKEYLDGDLKHKLIRHDDYILSPKRSGYRGIHLVYSYVSDKRQTYNGLNVEIQFRTPLQHSWATAVEVVGFFRKELLKSSEGDPVWKHFFKLMAAEITFLEKARVGIPGMATDHNALRDELRRCAAHIGALDYLGAVGTGVGSVVETNIPGSHYFLLQLDTSARKLEVTGYQLNARQRATWDYGQVEKAIMGQTEREAVLVSAQSMAELKRAYVNYFLDVSRFILLVETAIR